MSEWSRDSVIEALDTDDEARVVEAAEAVAAAAGFPGELLSEAGREWAETHGVPPDELIDHALRRVVALCAGLENDEALAELRDLRYRLGDALAR
ncbi:MAG TPA: hypothetical protein VHC67_00735 [Gaiellaceae bacterium]|jgi:hypothetical protein|nr:hypothetical protein [Gaiellaceae bacterium]